MNTSRRKSRKSFSSSMGGRGHQSNASEEAESSKGVSIRGRILEDEDRHQSIESIHVSSTFPSIVGTCTLMCPARERVQRERLRDLSVFERLNGHLGKTSPSLAVKKVKFYIVSHHKLLWSNCNPNISSMHYLNLEQLRKSLSSLYDMYDANRKSSSISKNEAEFRSFYVLLHLSSNSQSVGGSLSLWFQRLASPILKSKEMCFTRKVLRFFRLGNYKCFFATIATESSYLQYCLMEPYINELRILVVSYINYGGYAHSPYPLAQLSKLLRMKESDMESLCNACGLETSIDKVGNKFLPTKQATFHPPKGGFQNYSFLGLEKLQRHTRDEDCITTNQAS
ncbi:SAC3 family protein C isoform X5 [Macadamia integrifolia]|uniref:SAC3 family protein C isoform X5 n=1 Tax=Macadamia integrifolia TaxID=60698 RepID=UPI001C52D38F|nr:SAC3 family protein C isoform X5 [Macadamia integrifolia]